LSGQGIAQILFYAVALTALAYPLGLYMARVYSGQPVILDRWLGGFERGFYRLLRTGRQRRAGWKSYAKSVLVFSAVFSGFLYLLLRLQGHLPLNPDGLKDVPSHIVWVPNIRFRLGVPAIISSARSAEREAKRCVGSAALRDVPSLLDRERRSGAGE
jgi:K+-transporting ATPase A subunit